MVNRPQKLDGRWTAKRRAWRHGFSVIDLLVSICVVAILIGLLAPTLRGVRETARRVVCSSNIRQMGIGISQYAEYQKDQLPPTAFLDTGTGHSPRHAEMMRLRVDAVPDEVRRSGWDGLGHLYGQDILGVPMLFYCPSHTGDHHFTRYSDRWLSLNGQIMGNYQYRGQGPNGAKHLSRIEPIRTALVADGMRTRADFSHGNGGNVLRADLSVFWFSDPNGAFASGLPDQIGSGSSALVDQAWGVLDSKDH